MSKKYIIIISGMLIIALSIFVMMSILSHRASDVKGNEETISNVTKTLDAPGHISTPKKKKEVVLKEEAQADDTQEMSEAADKRRNEEIQEFLDYLDSLSQVESQNDEVSKAKEKAAKYAVLKEPLQQIRDLSAQLDSRFSREKFEEVKETFRIVNGKIVMDEIAEFLDEKAAICQQILDTAEEVQRIAPNAIEIIKVSYLGNNIDPRSGPERISYDIKISRQNLESSFGKIPADMEAIFLSEHKSVVVLADENFNWVKWYRDNERERLAK